MSSANQFYVYVYYRRDGSPFYVGKGKGSRYKSHLRPEAKDRSPKAMLIREMMAASTPPDIRKLAEGLSEKAAFNLERDTIKRIGRHPHGPLLNKSDGGEGWVPGPNPEEVAWLREMRRQEREQRRAEKAARDAARAAEQQSRQPGLTPQCDQQDYVPLAEAMRRAFLLPERPQVLLSPAQPA